VVGWVGLVRCDGVFWEERGKAGGRGGEGDEGEVGGRCHCDLFRSCYEM
jgi:hypothetical protein